MARLETSAEKPMPVRTVVRLVGEWVDRLGSVWVDGQVTQLNTGARGATAYFVLRDTSVDISMPASAPTAVLSTLEPPLSQGARVVAQVRPDFYRPRGKLSLRASSIRHVGVGELLAQLERLRATFRAEGLFAPERKRPLPFLPTTVGLVTGRETAAEQDVITVARRRWPAVNFRIENVPVQGIQAVPEVIAALQRLEADPQVDVIVVARGGGSLEDLLPFSDEALCRQVASCRTPVVSAIGHETDNPIVDLVADVRAATPTDAAKQVVPDAATEHRAVDQARARALLALRRRLDHERTALSRLTSRPVLSRPESHVDDRAREITRLRASGLRALSRSLEHAELDVSHARARVRALSPLATLSRGYAVLQDDEGHLLRSATMVSVGDSLTVRLADGLVPVTVSRAPEVRAPEVVEDSSD